MSGENEPSQQLIDQCAQYCYVWNSEVAQIDPCSCRACGGAEAIAKEINLCVPASKWQICKINCKGVCDINATCTDCDANSVFINNRCTIVNSLEYCLNVKQADEYCKEFHGLYSPTICTEFVSLDGAKCLNSVQNCMEKCNNVLLSCSTRGDCVLCPANQQLNEVLGICVQEGRLLIPVIVVILFLFLLLVIVFYITDRKRKKQ